ncbi:MAG TPA: hypothetical protein VEA78_05470, partial [Acidimicrobiales bacterium]|nr:hypothetical protein [Acidimicrobiales bacterium]
MGETAAREVSGIIPAGFVLYVHQACGDEAATRVARELGLAVEDVDWAAWYPAADVVRVAQVAYAETLDPDIGGRSADAFFRQAMEIGI